MAVITDWGTAFLTAISNAFSKFFGFLPDLIGALLILWIGWFVANLLAKLVTNVLRKVRFNEAADKAGLSRFIQSSGVRKDASEVMGEIVKWFFRLIALVAAFSVLQLPALTTALTGILNFIPNLFIALVIILVGSLIANFVSDFVKGAANSGGFGNANTVGNIARYAILYVAVIAALGQLGIAETVINTIFIGTVAALALGIGLAFGLGGRETASRIWENTYNSAQQNLPKLSQGMRQQAQNQRQRLQQGLQQANQNLYNNSNNPRPVTGYAASSQTPPAPPSGGVYNAPPPSAPSSGGYYAGGNQPQPQPQQGQGGYYGGNSQPQTPPQGGGYYGDGQSQTPPQSSGYYGDGQPRPEGDDGSYYGNNQPRPDSNNSGGYYNNGGQSQSQSQRGDYYDPDNTNYPRP